MAKFDLSFLDISTEEDDPNMKLWKRSGSIGDILGEEEEAPSRSGPLSPRVQLAVKRSTQRNVNSPRRSPHRAPPKLKPEVLKSARSSLKNLFAETRPSAFTRSKQYSANESISSPVSPLRRSTSDHFKAKGFSALDGDNKTGSEVPDDVPRAVLSKSSPSREFLCRPIPKQAGIIQCTLKRSSKQKEVSLYFQHYGRTGAFIMSAYKRRGIGPATFTISSRPIEFHKDTRAHLAVVKANLLKEKYDVFEAPQPGMPKLQIGSCFYEVNEDSPRKTTLLIPEFGSNGKPSRWRVQHKKDSMFEQYVRNRTMDMAVYSNVFPHYDSNLDRYVLDLSRRATKPSVKNTVVNGHRSTSRVWLFGKTGPDTFNLDFAYPFTPLQAFAFAIATLHSKS